MTNRIIEVFPKKGDHIIVLLDQHLTIEDMVAVVDACARRAEEMGWDPTEYEKRQISSGEPWQRP